MSCLTLRGNPSRIYPRGLLDIVNTREKGMFDCSDDKDMSFGESRFFHVRPRRRVKSVKEANRAVGTMNVQVTHWDPSCSIDFG